MYVVVLVIGQLEVIILKEVRFILLLLYWVDFDPYRLYFLFSNWVGMLSNNSSAAASPLRNFR